MSIRSEEVNYLIYRYLQECGRVLRFANEQQDLSTALLSFRTRV